MTHEELIVLLDEAHVPIGSAPKLASHHADTPLHLAFSCYVFNEKGQLLVTKRANSKKVWPGVWTNTCCGHPGPNEMIEAAINRRLDDELGMKVTDIKVAVPEYAYCTPPFNGIIENEFCPIYVARANSAPQPNPEEVSEFAWISWAAFIETATKDANDTWSWWCKDQISHLEHHPLVSEYSHAT